MYIGIYVLNSIFAKKNYMYQISELSNGIRLVHKYVDSDVAHCGIIINTGSRDEDENQSGLAHFTEHMLFKGTKHRKTFHILSRLEDVGGEIDAYTSKEETCVTASFLNEFYERAIELLNDVVFNSTFPEREFEREREVIIDEINSYKDSPVDTIYDLFEEMIFPKHPLGRNILGSQKLLKKFKVDEIRTFVAKKYNTDQMVFASIGKIKFDRLQKLCKKYLEQNPANYRNYKRIEFNNKTVFEKKIARKTHQLHCIIGTYAYSYKNPKRLPFFMINNLLAGPGMNSRLNLLLREKKGFSYNIESNYTNYEDTGSFTIYFSSDKNNHEIALELIFKEFSALKSKSLGTLQLNKMKKQLIGQLAIANEIHSNVLMGIGKSVLVYNNVETLKEMYSEIEKVTESDILEVANEILNKDNFSKLIFY
jgi:predicted Zn-dependent peptidase